MLILTICIFVLSLFLLVASAMSQNEEAALLSAMSVLVFGFFMGYQFQLRGIQEGLKNYKSYKPQITGTYENGKFIATDTTFIKVKK